MTDEREFAEPSSRIAAELHAHCYRMLGSPFDADDALQETLLRAWRGRGGFDPDRPQRPWRYRIATNVCLDALAKRPKRVLPVDHGPPAGPGEGPGEPVVELIWLEPYPDDLLDEAPFAAPEARYEQREISNRVRRRASTPDGQPARGADPPRHARLLGPRGRRVAGDDGRLGQQLDAAGPQDRRRAAAGAQPAADQRELGDDELRELVREYVAAWESRDVDAMVEMLVEGATFAMPPHPHWFRGRDAVIAFLAATGQPDLRHVITRANGQPAIGWYLWDSPSELYRPASTSRCSRSAATG